MSKIKISIAGGSGYAGGELLRLLLLHPNVEIQQVSSERHFGKLVYKIHPNLRKQSTLKFCSLSDLDECDVLFLCLPHGASISNINVYKNKAKKIIDLSADFRLDSNEAYKKWYKKDHALPQILTDFIYGIPELRRDEMKEASFVSSAGCNATATILALYPLYKNKLVQLDKTVVEVKVGSSEGGNKNSDHTILYEADVYGLLPRLATGTWQKWSRNSALVKRPVFISRQHPSIWCAGC
jgi:[amino group carrier protein]-6-phospho-L-2-aminoadipate/5-phospho-L-glutamate reductase